MLRLSPEKLKVGDTDGKEDYSCGENHLGDLEGWHDLIGWEMRLEKENIVVGCCIEGKKRRCGEVWRMKKEGTCGRLGKLWKEER